MSKKELCKYIINMEAAKSLSSNKDFESEEVEEIEEMSKKQLKEKLTKLNGKQNTSDGNDGWFGAIMFTMGLFFIIFLIGYGTGYNSRFSKNTATDLEEVKTVLNKLHHLVYHVAERNTEITNDVGQIKGSIEQSIINGSNSTNDVQDSFKKFVNIVLNDIKSSRFLIFLLTVIGSLILSAILCFVLNIICKNSTIIFEYVFPVCVGAFYILLIIK
jgi:hypothetical protein